MQWHSRGLPASPVRKKRKRERKKEKKRKKKGIKKRKGKKEKERHKEREGVRMSGVTCSANIYVLGI